MTFDELQEERKNAQRLLIVLIHGLELGDVIKDTELGKEFTNEQVKNALEYALYLVMCTHLEPNEGDKTSENESNTKVH